MIAKELRGLLNDAHRLAVSDGLLPPGELPEFTLERPRQKAHGHWATNLALVLAGTARENPRRIAEVIVGKLKNIDSNGPSVFERVEVAGPGFINMFLRKERILAELARVAREGEDYGRWSFGEGKAILVEFVSANPVGPLHVGHGRWAAFGDALCNLLEAVGYRVEREFYLNDFGTQMENFAASVEARYLQLGGVEAEVPEDGYHGSYVTDIAREIWAEEGGRWMDAPPEERRRHLGEVAYRKMLEEIRSTLEELGVRFDHWFSEREMHRRGEVEGVIRDLLEKGLAYEKDGAVWMATSRFGDEKDRVLVRSNGQPTYFAADIAYHLDKARREYWRLINIWGADHHGYVKRLQAAMEAQGYPDKLEVILGQLVNLKRGGEPVRMSKRTGEMVTFKELLDEVGRDVARYIFLTRSQDSPLDFDIELAKAESMENPVYYVQYAHARICSIMRYAEERGVKARGGVPAPSVLERLGAEEEMDLALKLFEFEELVRDAALERAPHRLTRYLEELSALYHLFYQRHRVIGDDPELTEARIFLSLCARQVLANGLRILGVSAPERM
ncbi:MAG: arginine--tRNA ligase [Candidatus Geothermincolales bacterium]